MSDEPEVGDWVQVYGQRVATPYSNEHPEDWVVQFSSHNEHYLGHVRRDWTKKCDPPVGIATRCTSLWSADQGETLIRCKKHYDHGGLHGNGSQHWERAQTFGYMEDS